MTAFRMMTPAFLDAPGPALARLRAEAPVVRVRLPVVGDTWMTTTDAAARAMLKDETRFVRDPYPVTGRPLSSRFWWMPRAVKPLFGGLLSSDGEKHRRLRRVVDAAFARTTVEGLRPDLARMADALIDRLPETGPVDVSAGLCHPLPFQAICLLLGLPEEDEAWLHARVSPLSAMENLPKAAYAMYRLGGVMAYFQNRIEMARRGGHPGLLGALAAEDTARDLSDLDLQTLFMTLFLAGHETTVHLLNHAIIAIAGDDALRARLLDPGADVKPLVDEMLRWHSLIMVSALHVVAEDTEFEGVALKRGDQIMAGLLAANRDPARHGAPDTLLPDRRPNAHLGFGFGPHVCLGMQLGRAEAEIVLTRLFRRHPRLVLDGPPPGWRRRVGLRVRRNVVVRLEG